MYAFNIKMILSLLILMSSVNGCGGSGVSISVLPSVDEFTQNTNADVKIDILFVIDDSGSMSGEQQSLFNSFSSFINLFYDKGFDFRVAVAKTSAYGTQVACKLISSGANSTCSEAQYASGLYISRESGLTPKEFRCGFGNNCGVNSNLQTESVIAGAVDEGGESLKTTIGNGTPAIGTDHILASSNLSKNSMIAKFRKNILVGLAGTGDERAIEAAETVIRRMAAVYNTPETQFPRPGAHLAVIHLGDEGDGPIPNNTESGLQGSNNSNTWGSLRSTTINSIGVGYPAITLVSPNTSANMNQHLNAVDSYLDALKFHEPTGTVSVHAIQDLPSSANIGLFPFLGNIPSTAVDTCGSTTNNAGNSLGFFQAYMAAESGGLVLSKCNSNFGPLLAQLGDTISSLASFFTLGGPLDAFAQSNLKVYVEGINGNNPLPNSAVNGYQYEPATNRIRFFGSMIPPQGAIIGIQYTCGSLNPLECYTP